ncbi:MAG: class II fructose-bisphosphate aldolase [Alphaproteobacteria bacterium TMED89]|nr:fructose-bisphosphate aldolase [Rhodospirillaceae bacterium]RPH12245.1 MAG: class II fructose-bisphosphate aldolase [Alphaproteobacteria bacterium TMED89]
MPLVTLRKVLSAAQDRQGLALGFVCQGWEDSRAYVKAGEAAGAPVILSAGPDARANMPVQLWGEMFRELARSASVPVVAHLDHGRTLEECEAAIDAGFSSVMIDGSTLPLAENIALTNAVSAAAGQYGVSVEAEIGQVGYQDGAASEGTTLEEAEAFAAQTHVDALAISVGNLHLQTKDHAQIDWQRLAEIETVTTMPLVLHGGSGILPADRLRLAREHRVRKLNVGTELRQCFGAEIREVLDADPALFDRTAILTRAEPALQRLAEALLNRAWNA